MPQFSFIYHLENSDAVADCSISRREQFKNCETFKLEPHKNSNKINFKI